MEYLEKRIWGEKKLKFYKNKLVKLLDKFYFLENKDVSFVTCWVMQPFMVVP